MDNFSYKSNEFNFPNRINYKIIFNEEENFIKKNFNDFINDLPEILNNLNIYIQNNNFNLFLNNLNYIKNIINYNKNLFLNEIIIEFFLNSLIISNLIKKLIINKNFINNLEIETEETLFINEIFYFLSILSNISKNYTLEIYNNNFINIFIENFDWYNLNSINYSFFIIHDIINDLTNEICLNIYNSGIINKCLIYLTNDLEYIQESTSTLLSIFFKKTFEILPIFTNLFYNNYLILFKEIKIKGKIPILRLLLYFILNNQIDSSILIKDFKNILFFQSIYHYMINFDNELSSISIKLIRTIITNPLIDLIIKNKCVILLPWSCIIPRIESQHKNDKQYLSLILDIIKLDFLPPEKNEPFWLIFLRHEIIINLLNVYNKMSFKSRNLTLLIFLLLLEINEIKLIIYLYEIKIIDLLINILLDSDDINLLKKILNNLEIYLNYLNLYNLNFKNEIFFNIEKLIDNELITDQITILIKNYF